MKASLFRSFVLGMAAMSALAGASQAAVRSWDNGALTQDWHTAANWSDNTLPDTGDFAYIGAFAGTTSPIITSAAGTFNEVQVNNTTSGDGLLTVNSGGSVTAATIFVGLYGTSTGTVTQNGGTVTATSNLRLGWDNTATGTYILNDGTLTVNGGGTLIGSRPGTSGFIVQNGGTISSDATGSVGGTERVGVLTVRDSAKTSFNKLEVGLDFGGSGGAGKVVLDGSKTGDGGDLTTVQDFIMGKASTLSGIIDADAIANASVMRKVSAGFVRFDPGSLLDVGFDDLATPTSGTWTLLTAGGIADSANLAFAPGVDSGWSFGFVGGNSLQVTYTATAVPEPASIGLVLLGGLLGTRALGRRNGRLA
jgi:hypothetical protein